MLIRHSPSGTPAPLPAWPTPPRADDPRGRRALLRGLGAAALLGAAFPWLGGCGETTLGAAPATLRLAFGDRPEPDLARLAALPYRSAVARLGRGPRAALVLASREPDGTGQWVGADRTLLVRRGGRLLRTVGLARDLAGCAALGPDPLAAGGLDRLPAEGVALRRRLDFGPGGPYGIALESRLQPDGREPTPDDAAGSERRPLWRVVEVGQAPALGWAFEDRHWFDPSTGQVVRSLLAVAPGLPLLAFVLVMQRRPA